MESVSGRRTHAGNPPLLVLDAEMVVEESGEMLVSLLDSPHPTLKRLVAGYRPITHRLLAEGGICKFRAFFSVSIYIKLKTQKLKVLKHKLT